MVLLFSELLSSLIWWWVVYQARDLCEREGISEEPSKDKENNKSRDVSTSW